MASHTFRSDQLSLPSGNPSNATTTACAYNDAQCGDLCATSWWPCYASWSSWTRYDVQITSVPYNYTNLWTETRTSYNLSTTTWMVDEAAEPYFYVLGTGKPYLTTSGVQVYTMYYQSVISTRKPSPNCTYIPCTVASQPDPATCSSCEVQGGTVELLYWADMATTSLSESWQQNGSSPVTALYKNMTLTSPTVYIEFQTAFATDACGRTVGGAYPGAIIGVNPKSLYSVQAQFDYFVELLDEGETSTTFYQSAQFNFEDLSGLVPASAWAAQPSCVANHGGCYTIYPDEYHPVLVIPSHIRNMDPAWKSCGLDWRGAWDPPTALRPAAVIASVTTAPGIAPTTPASPPSSVAGPATRTAAAESGMWTATPSATSNAVNPSSQEAVIDPAPTPNVSNPSLLTSALQDSLQDGGASSSESTVASTSAWQTDQDSSPASLTTDLGKNYDPASNTAAVVPATPELSRSTFATMSTSGQATTIIGNNGDPAPSAHGPTNALGVLSEALRTDTAASTTRPQASTVPSNEIVTWTSSKSLPSRPQTFVDTTQSARELSTSRPLPAVTTASLNGIGMPSSTSETLASSATTAGSRRAIKIPLITLIWALLALPACLIVR
ncbi:hypothetical protein BAUCODRAFT_145707 [Baudoinia panamericana UAMH 10762]|uniref:Uncharacterized protein n=1 Tax=Baudoinia panamericana (strain UAMH 10762) TaxID=717646 RepID=M2NHW4_BAUPA|nr:uncharacterized protein BAUCODRAFT_145707 [Baudoinia panamericana UAMH 10762]EMC98660.1 hypothetical protein BAUCODRAFT_145707 [Baudoinia panamericana UAMH 10762]